MKLNLRYFALITSLLLLAVVYYADAKMRSATAMADGATRFLAALTPEQAAVAKMAFDDANRLDWHYIPRARKGIPLKDLNESQRKLAHDFLKTGLSAKGYQKTETIISLELVLRELEKNPTRRDPELYYFSIFGTPSAKDAWGWRVEGHHVSLNFTVAAGRMVATTPSFLGANPAEVREGPRKGLRALQAEEDMGRQLLDALDESQRARAVYDAKAPGDIITTFTNKADPLAAAGIPATALTRSQAALLQALVHEYASTMPADLAAERLEKVKRAGWDKLYFAWAGGGQRGQPHYYRVQGPTFLIEYDNTQNNANHIHSVWRDFQGDFGRDLLREHYAKHAHK